MEYSSDIQDFKVIYEYLMTRIYNNPNYDLKLNNRIITLLKSFFKKTCIKTSDGIWQYMLFTIVLNDNKYSNQKALTLNNCISASKIKKWNERTSQQLYLVAKFQKQRGYRNPLKQIVDISEEFYDDIRCKDMNTSKGYIRCQEYDLFDNLKCLDCRFFDVCLKNNYDY